MNNFDAETLLQAFPMEVSETSRMAMIAAIVAEELQSLSDDHDLLAIYTQIDKLDGPMLDILAIDFKIDWWDANADLEKKRELFKSCFTIHRKLGTIGAVSQAISETYSDTQVKEWFEYNGQPYHYKLSIGLGEQFGSAEVIRNILYRSKFYTNVRSVMENIDFRSTRTRNLFYGCALMSGLIARYEVAGIDISLTYVITDEDGEFLTDETDDILMSQ